MNKIIKSLLRSKLFLKILAICLAIFCWLGVVMSDTSSITRQIKNVPLNTAIQELALQQLGLNIIDMETKTVTAEVRGDRVAVGLLEPEQLAATIQLSASYTDSGTYELQVIPAATTTSIVGIQNQSYEILSYSPGYLKVRLDRVEAREFPLEVDINGEIQVSPGFIREKDEVLTPDTINISGPVTELDKIARCVVTLEDDQLLERTYVAPELPIKLLDLEGTEIDPALRHLSLDHATAQLVIAVLKEKDLPLTIDYLQLPRNFPKEDLQYTLSNYEIAVAAPVDAAAKYKELALGYVDLSQLGPDNNSFVFDVPLPKGFVNLDNITTVTVTFDRSNWSTALYSIDNVRLFNQPDGMKVELVTQQLHNVVLVGNQDILAALTPEDLVAEIDLSEKQLSIGQYQYPVKISAPAKGLVWAYGTYNVVLQVSPDTEA